MAAKAGQLQLNVMEPVIDYSMLQSISLLTDAARVVGEKCIIGITTMRNDNSSDPADRV